MIGFPVLPVVNAVAVILAVLVVGGFILVLVKRKKSSEMYIKRQKQIQAFPPGHRR